MTTKRFKIFKVCSFSCHNVGDYGYGEHFFLHDSLGEWVELPFDEYLELVKYLNQNETSQRYIFVEEYLGEELLTSIEEAKRLAKRNKERVEAEEAKRFARKQKKDQNTKAKRLAKYEELKKEFEV